MVVVPHVTWRRLFGNGTYLSIWTRPNGRCETTTPSSGCTRCCTRETWPARRSFAYNAVTGALDTVLSRLGHASIGLPSGLVHDCVAATFPFDRSLANMKAYYWMPAGLLLLLSCHPNGDEGSIQSRTRDGVRLPVASGQPPVGQEDTAASASSNGCQPLWPSAVHLSGIVRTEERFGPPGYGEMPDQDARLTIYILELDEAQDICAGSQGGEPVSAMNHVRRLQLAGSVHPAILRSHVGRRIQVNGSLSHQVWGTDFTAMILVVHHASYDG